MAKINLYRRGLLSFNEMREREMAIRAIMMGAYISEGAKGIIGGWDRMAAVKAVAEVADGSVNHVSFLRGKMDGRQN